MKRILMSVMVIIGLGITLFPQLIKAAETNKVMDGDLNFTDVGTPEGDIENDGYHWDDTTNTLSMKNFTLNGTLTLPDSKGKARITVKVKTEGNCSIKTFELKTPNSYEDRSVDTTINFSGAGTLSIEDRISLSLADRIILEAGSTLNMKNGIDVGTSGGADSSITINGNMNAQDPSSSELEDPCVYCGTVKIGATGKLTVSGKAGVKVCGNSNPLDFTNAFQIIEGGIFDANCSRYTVIVFTEKNGGNVLTLDAAKKMLVLPANYIPNTHKMVVLSGDNGGIEYLITIVPKESEPSFESGYLDKAGSKLEMKKQVVSPSTTEATTKASTEEHTTEKQTTEKNTEVATENATEVSTEVKTEVTTEKTTEVTTEQITQEEKLPEEETPKTTEKKNQKEDSEKADMDVPETGDSVWMMVSFIAFGFAFFSMIALLLWKRKTIR